MLLPIRHGSAVLVDLNGFQRKLLRTLLRSSGFTRVSEFENMEIGLDEASRSFPDFLFIDHDTAMESELLRTTKDIRESYLGKNTNLVVLMQNPTRQRVDKAISFGAQWVISRPFSPKSLHERMKAILDPGYGAPLEHQLSGPRKVEPTFSRDALEDLSMAELAAQMDALLKQSQYLKKGNPNHCENARQEILTQVQHLEKELYDRQARMAKKQSQSDSGDESVFLI